MPKTAPADRSSPALALSVLHGDLGFIAQPLMLGHYRASELTGSEAVVNRLIGGAMAKALLLRQYPDLPGTHQCFANRRPVVGADGPAQAHPACVVVVGLGSEGGLRASELSHTVQQGTLALAQRLVEQAAGDTVPPASFELASTLMGSGGVGISAGQSGQAIAQGVLAADQALAALNEGLPPGAQRWPRVARLVLIELYLSRASEAWRALGAWSEVQTGTCRLTPVIDSLPGGLRRPNEGGYRGAGHDYLRALGGRDHRGQAILSYSIDSRRRARTEQFSQPVQPRLLRQLVTSAASFTGSAGTSATDPDIGRVLFQLLVPWELEPFLAGSTDMVLQVDAASAGLPWELLDDGRPRDRSRPDDAPWALRTRLIRTLLTAEFRAQPQEAGAQANVLVIGEPLCDEASWPRLPGARQEALAVSALLGASTALQPGQLATLVSLEEDLPGPDAQAVIGGLLARDWRVVHIAGHGAATADRGSGANASAAAGHSAQAPGEDAASAVDRRSAAGVVLSGGTFLGPSEIESMRVVPELVFLNCCHLAARPAEDLLADPSTLDRAHFASTVAEALIRIGVRCVVAAGWAVEDQPAADFATAFYRALLRGTRFIEAVAEARAAAWRAGGNTWAAYQCYGDPNWRLLRDSDAAPPAPVPPADRFAHIASPPDLALALETIAIECEFQGRDLAERRGWLTWLAVQHAARWGDIGAVAEAFGVAWAAAGSAQEALTWTARARDAADGSASLQVLRRLDALATATRRQRGPA